MESSSSKAWSWRMKAAVNHQIPNSFVNGSVDEVDDKLALEVELQSLKDKLLMAESEIRAKDELVRKNAMFAQEAIAGWEKSESETLSIREALEITLHQCRVSEERSEHLDGSLRECMQQLRFVGEQQEQRVHDVLLRAAAEFEKTNIGLEEELLETGKRMSRLGVENARLSEALLLKDKVIQEIQEVMTGVETDCNLLKTRLDTTKKENASLKYEIRVLEKELEIRNEEREFNRRAADASHKKQLENVKKLAKLESECQRLRVLVQKQLPGPVGLGNMKDKVAILEKDSAENRQTRKNDFCVDDFLDTPNRRIHSLTKELYALEEENSNLKKTINYNANEIQISKAMYVRTASRLSQLENLLEELSKEKDAMNLLTSQERVISVLSDIGSDEKFSFAGSLASALNSGQGQQGGKATNITSIRPTGITDMNLMDDFLEMEKLAVIYAGKSVQNSHILRDVVNASSGPIPIDTESNGHLTEVSGPETIHFSDAQSQSMVMDQSVHTPDWLQRILKLILEQQHLTQRSHVDLLCELQAAMETLFSSKASKSVAPICQCQYDSPKSPYGNASNTWPYISSSKDSHGTSTNSDILVSGKSSQQVQPSLTDAVCKMRELLEGIHLNSPGLNAAEPFNRSLLTGNSSEIDSGYMVRVFQWKTCELSHVLIHLVQTCNDLLNGKDRIEKFVVSLMSAFNWIMNHCFSIQDVSNMRDEIKKHLGWDDTRSECETEVGSSSHMMEATKFRFSRDQASPNVTTFNCRNALFEDSPREGSQKMNDELINVELLKDLETKLRDTVDECERLQHELLMSEKMVLSLQKQLETLKESKRMAEDQTEKHMFANEELHSQLTEARVDLNETFQKIVSLEVELENKSAYCEDLEATCVELQLQLQSFVKELPNESANLERQLLKDWEFATATEKLAECQETILNLGRQLKAIASPREAPLFDKAIVSAPPLPTTSPLNETTPIKKTMNRQRTSLLEKMLADDDVDSSPAIAFTSPKTKEMTTTLLPVPQPATSVHIQTTTTEPLEKSSSQSIIIQLPDDDEDAVKSLMVLQIKKRGGGWSLWRKLFRRRRGMSRKSSLSSATSL